MKKFDREKDKLFAIKNFLRGSVVIEKGKEIPTHNLDDYTINNMIKKSKIAEIRSPQSEPQKNKFTIKT